MRVDGGRVDLRVENIIYDGVTAVVITKLPTKFALSNGDSIDVFQEELQYKTDAQ
jgi:hypothetical protein